MTSVAKKPIHETWTNTNTTKETWTGQLTKRPKGRGR
jgi:hypothetical protein